MPLVLARVSSRRRGGLLCRLLQMHPFVLAQKTKCHCRLSRGRYLSTEVGLSCRLIFSAPVVIWMTEVHGRLRVVRVPSTGTHQAARSVAVSEEEGPLGLQPSGRMKI